ncbi:MAG: VWA domain-containing protein [Thermoanaerobaculia bacterium]
MMTLAATIGFAAQAPDQPRFRTSLQVSAIEITMDVRDAKGNIPTDLTPSDFEVLEDGKPVKIIGLERIAESIGESAGTASLTSEKTSEAEGGKNVSIVVYFEDDLLSPQSLRDAAARLAGQVDTLTRLGTVEIVAADPSPKVLVPATRDRAELVEALANLAREGIGRRRLLNVRRRFVEEMNGIAESSFAMQGMGSQMTVVALAQRKARLILTSVAEEERIIRERHDQLIRYLTGAHGAEGTKALVLISDGYDLDPVDFYQGFVNVPAVERELQPQLQQRSSEPANEELAKEISSYGWIALSVASGYMVPIAGSDASIRGDDRMQSFLKPGGGGTGEAKFLFTHPLDVLDSYADATGGQVITDVGKIGSLVERLTQRYRLTYQVSRFGDTKLHRVTVKSKRPGLVINAQQWVGFQPLEVLAEARARTALEGRIDPGDLAVAARALPASKSGTVKLDVRTGFGALDALRPQLKSTSLRFTIAVDGKAGPVTHVETRDHVDLATNEGIEWDPEIRVSSDATKIAIVVEELSTGAWGEALIPLSGSTEPALSASTEATAASVVDSASWRAALERAKRENKLVFARFGCSSDQYHACAMVAEKEKALLADPIVSRRLGRFVPFESTRPYFEMKGSPNGPAKLYLTNHDGVPATFIIFDPWGTRRMAFSVDSPEIVAGWLEAASTGAPKFIDGAIRLRGGDESTGHLAIGVGYLDAQQYGDAKSELDLARAAALKNGKASLAQSIEAQLAWVEFLEGKHDEALAAVEAIAKNPVDGSAAAAAWLARATMESRTAQNDRPVVEALKKAVDAAPEGSEYAKIAIDALRALGEWKRESAAPNSTNEDIRVVPPPRSALIGRQKFTTLIFNPEIRRVRFLLDDVEAANVKEPPFSARIDLGKIPRVRWVKAEAYDGEGKLVGVDAIPVNGRADDFSVKILTPETPKASGKTAVELAVHAPEGKKVAGVEVYWNELLVGRMSRPPWRRSVALPETPVPGYLRAVATLDDGTTAEDVKMVNAEGATASVKIDLVELYATVEHADGTPVASIAPSDLVVEEDRRRERVDRVVPAASIPLTLGLLIDTSGSMKSVMVPMQEAAIRFLEQTLTENDEAFVAEFKTRPHLVTPATGELKVLSKEIIDTVAGGRTAVWDSIAFALMQFQGLGGRKALVVLTDAQDNNSVYSLNTCMDLAKRTGVPVYVVYINSKPGEQGLYGWHDTTERTVAVRSASGGFSALDNRRGIYDMKRLSSGSGGLFLELKGFDQLEKRYSEIRTELRNQQLIVYHSHSDKPSDRWRRVKVKATVSGVEIRTVSGYYPRE